jgi:hypothetical protein
MKKINMFKPFDICTSTSNLSTSTTITLQDLEESLEELKKLDPPNKEWILIDPKGNMWKSDNLIRLASMLLSHTSSPYTHSQQINDERDQVII